MVPAVPTAPVAGPAGPDDSRIVLRANALTWLLVKDKTGSVLLNKTLKPGDTWSVPPRADLLLTTGNAGGTDIVVDGTVTPSLGGSGVVRRDLALDPDQIRDGKLALTASPQAVSTHPHP
jgi:cytoskeleton protein RodZ